MFSLHRIIIAAAASMLLLVEPRMSPLWADEPTQSLAVRSSAQSSQVEPWSDPRLPEKGGLAAWYDGARQFAGRERLQLPPLPIGGPIAIWLDGSGHGRHALSRFGEAQPRFVPIGGGGVARFDGENDFLSATGARKSLDSFTLFIVAAPRSNAGFFRGLLAANQLGRNDYTSGFCVDLSGVASQQFDTLNIEGAGFGGAVDLLESAFPFGSWHTLEISAATGKDGVELWCDGKAQKSRDRVSSSMSIDELTIGARFYSNSELPPQVTSFFHGDIAEVLLYERRLTDDERLAVRAYLNDKWSEAAKLATGEGGRRLHLVEPVKNPPHV